MSPRKRTRAGGCVSKIETNSKSCKSSNKTGASDKPRSPLNTSKSQKSKRKRSVRLTRCDDVNVDAKKLRSKASKPEKSSKPRKAQKKQQKFLGSLKNLKKGASYLKEKFTHQMKELDAQTYQQLVQAGERVPFEPLLDPMLIPRVSGTENHAKVKQFIKSHMSGLGWTIETDAFQDNTPHGVKPFENIIATLNPNTPRRLVLACHYDSKYSDDGQFIGATDSAVPCAMLLHMASTMHTMLTEQKNSPQNVTLQFIFFDGEEAFQHWSSTDSLYGARHLAAKWGRTPYPANNQDGTTELHRMDMLVLLDLLGTSNPKLYSFFQETSHWHNALVQTEQQLKRSQYWSGSTRQSIFQNRQHYGGIEDDHIPFLQRGVDILHLIPSPFPTVWHKPSDNRDALHFPTISNLNKVFRLFVARYLMGTSGPTTTPSTSSGQTVTAGIMQHFLNYFNLPHLFGNRIPIM